MAEAGLCPRWVSLGYIWLRWHIASMWLLLGHQDWYFTIRALFSARHYSASPGYKHRTKQNLVPALETWGGARKGEIARKVSSLLQG